MDLMVRCISHESGFYKENGETHLLTTVLVFRSTYTIAVQNTYNNNKTTIIEPQLINLEYVITKIKLIKAD